MRRFGFGPASNDESIVFGAESPQHPRTCGNQAVEEWISYMKSQGIKRVVCLLSEEQLGFYNSLPDGILGAYCKAFGASNVLSEPVKELHLCDQESLKRIIEFLGEAESKKEPVVVHCYAGLGRTGHVLAAWLVHGRGLSAEQTLRTQTEMGRDPCEVIAHENAKKDDLMRLLTKC